jgi:hypothetical protein
VDVGVDVESVFVADSSVEVTVEVAFFLVPTVEVALSVKVESVGVVTTAVSSPATTGVVTEKATKIKLP